VKPLAEFLEARNALILTLKGHDQELKAKRRKPGKDRALIVEMLEDLGVVAWEYGEEPWAK
jgi:hypothetical protein